MKGGGETGALLRAHDWARSPLGPPETWPQALTTLVAVMLGSQQPMFVVWGPERTLLYNDPYAEILDAKHPAALGCDFLAVWAEIRADLEPIVAQAYAGIPVHMDDIELLLERKGYREETHFSFSYTPVRDEAGAVAGFLCPCNETTAQVMAERRRREAEVALRAERDRTRRVLDGMAEGFGLLDREFRILDINAEGLRLDGRPREALIGKTHWEAFPGSRDSELGRLYRRAMEERVPVSLEHRYEWADGHHAWLDMRAYPTDDGLALFWRDVTDRKRAEEALRLAHENAAREAAERAAIIGQLVEGVIVADAQGRITFVNEAAERLHGGSVLGVGPDGYSEAYRLLTMEGTPFPPHELPLARAVIDGETVEDARWRIRRPDGTEVLAIGSARPVIGPDAARVGAVLTLRDDTARHAAEAALRESEARFRLMADAVPQIVWITDGQGRTEFFNKQWTAYTGVPYEPTTATEVAARHVHPEDGERTMRAFEAARATGGAFAVEHRIRSASGSYRWFLVRAEPYRDPATGEIVRWFGASVDIHDRKLAEARLEALNGRLEAEVAERTAERDRMWAISPDLMLVIDFDGFFRRVNPAWTRLLGYEPDELVGRHVNEFVVPEDHAATVAAYELAAAGGRPEIVNRYRHKDGSIRWISWVAAPTGEMTYATGRDVTADKARQAELQAAEDARRRADALYRAYFENTAEALFVVGVAADGGFVVEDLNPAHQASIGLPLSEVRGRRIDEILPPEMAEAVSANYRQVVASGKVYQYRETFEVQNAPTIWDTVLVPVHDESGRIVRIIGASRDLTRQVAAEEQLRESQKMESLGQLTGGVAHDFNNLLTPIIGPLDMLVRRGIGNERERRLLDAALQSAERAKVLVQRLLAFARRQPLDPVAVDVGRLVEGIGDLIGSTLGPSIAIRIAIADGLPAAHADANQVEMALLNLAVNARDAMPNGGTLTIAASRAQARADEVRGLAPGEYVRLSVTDTGFGMDAATRARAIEPFFSTKPVGRGTGLGLSMVHGLAAQLGGGLGIESEPGRGTSVHLWLPLDGGAAAVAADAAETRARPSAARGVALVVDDEDLVRMTVADMLVDLGFEVVEAGSGEEALAMIRSGRRADLLVTDHLMPGMSGVDLARAARAARPGLPVLVVSGYAEVEALAPDLPRLAKPFRPAELTERVDALMRAEG
ncbi:MAG: PAS domain S-box protein [Salinarimonas sp.]